MEEPIKTAQDIGEEPCSASEGVCEDISNDAQSFPSSEVLSAHLREIFDYLSCYASAQFAKGKHSFKDALWSMVGWGIFIFVMVGILLTAVVFAFYGFSLWLGEATGRPWLGYLATGLFFLLIPGFWLKLQRASAKKASFKKEIQNYEQTLHDQRTRFGRDLESAASEQ